MVLIGRSSDCHFQGTEYKVHSVMTGLLDCFLVSLDHVDGLVGIIWQQDPDFHGCGSVGSVLVSFPTLHVKLSIAILFWADAKPLNEDRQGVATWAVPDSRSWWTTCAKC